MLIISTHTRTNLRNRTLGAAQLCSLVEQLITENEARYTMAAESPDPRGFIPSAKESIETSCRNRGIATKPANTPDHLKVISNTLIATANSGRTSAKFIPQCFGKDAAATETMLKELGYSVVKHVDTDIHYYDVSWGATSVAGNRQPSTLTKPQTSMQKANRLLGDVDDDD